MPKEIRPVTPELAALWLRGSTQFNDRDSFRENVEGLCERWRRGRWHPNLGHDAIHVHQGTMTNGNHRLHMVIKLGVSVLQVVLSDGSLDDPAAKPFRTGRWLPHATADDRTNEAFYGAVDTRAPTGRWNPLGRED